MMSDDHDPDGVRANLDQDFIPFHQARELLGKKSYQEVHSICVEMIDQNPDYADAYYVLGILFYEHHDFRNALDLFERAVQKGHPEPGVHAQLARCYLALSRPQEALAHIEMATARNPEDSYTLSSLGAALSRLDRHEEAVELHRKATELAPKDAFGFFNLGSSLQFLGDFDGAKAAYETALQIAPEYLKARAYLTLIKTHTREENDLPALQDAWEKRHPRDAEGGLQIAHAFAKVYEDLGEPKSVMTWLDKGKSLVREVIPNRRVQDKASFKAAKALSLTLKPDVDTIADGPIFITGLPRTGTTLTDRILSSHSQVVSAGERTEFAACLQRGAQQQGKHVLDAQTISMATEVELSSVGAVYLDDVKAILNTSHRFTDKLPLNVFFAPAILTALPSARMICLRRHPVDSVLSVYRQLFALSAIEYRCAHDLQDLANFVADFYELVEHLSETLPASRFRIVDYETLATEPETEIRQLLEFCGLPFEEACLEFQKNRAPVATASVAQVRQPMYTSSIARWERYKDHLGPALAVLNDRGLLD
ncbi:sulfotransferase [Hyphomonas sp. FCG-A18]|uniref:tetratricopeptide repeat-containing sulfotransferase family protein n=1 Tax=Hyphomonas sp. FCG-A18 TaxID=3080019 RepID=UPI002B2FA50C|nr:sulfotransferase [Hyphomonas sp. FCG-A18]